ncbi:MAG: sigma-70 family RNA polymerase sigma factor [Rhodobacteraceae bacterium]|nr:sigma-70 family RNA polymerase sigma factor [Paracoccaceae bacterium]
MADDRELLQRISVSDREAMRAFYERYHTALFAFIRGRGTDPAAAADTVQDAMLEVWRSAGRYRGEAAAKTWLFSIARNKLIDRTRKGARLSHVEDVPETVDEAPDPEAVMIASSEAARVRACLGRLKPAHLSVIRLAFYEDLTYGEISEIEDVPAGTVKTRIFHAKKLLLRCLGKR